MLEISDVDLDKTSDQFRRKRLEILSMLPALEISAFQINFKALSSEVLFKQKSSVTVKMELKKRLF